MVSSDLTIVKQSPFFGSKSTAALDTGQSLGAKRGFREVKISNMSAHSSLLFKSFTKKQKLSPADSAEGLMGGNQTDVSNAHFGAVVGKENLTSFSGSSVGGDQEKNVNGDSVLEVKKSKLSKFMRVLSSKNV